MLIEAPRRDGKITTWPDAGKITRPAREYLSAVDQAAATEAAEGDAENNEMPPGNPPARWTAGVAATKTMLEADPGVFRPKAGAAGSRCRLWIGAADLRRLTPTIIKPTYR
jgi:hypothetical protein